MKLGIFGGTFNPIHIGHITASLKFYDEIGLDKMLVIPNAVPPHKTEQLADSTHRLTMVRLAYGDKDVIGERNVEVSDIEISLGGKSYTSNTLDALRTEYPDADFYMYLGSDAYLRLDKWYMSEKIFGSCNFVTVARTEQRKKELEKASDIYRKKYGCLTVIMNYEPISVSSADIRKAIRENDIAFGNFTKKVLTESVYGYIIKSNLYSNDDE